MPTFTHFRNKTIQLTIKREKNLVKSYVCSIVYTTTSVASELHRGPHGLMNSYLIGHKTVFRNIFMIGCIWLEFESLKSDK